jgi:DNA-binding response OmpR family regulator
VAEDDPAQLQALTAFLRCAGYQVYPTRDGSEALRVAAEVRPDAAICDWDLGGGLDGTDVMRRLLQADPSLLPILVSGNDIASLRSVTRSLAGAHCLAKPIAPDRLLEALGCRAVSAGWPDARYG